MNRSRPLVIVIAMVSVLAPTVVIATHGAPAGGFLEPGDGFIASDDGDAFVFRLDGEAPLTAAGLEIVTTTPESLPPPLDQTPLDATIYEVRADAGADAGPLSYMRLQDRLGLSFVTGDETPVILRAAIGSGPPMFLEDQRIIRLPPPCSGGTDIGTGCQNGDVSLALARLLASESLGYGLGPAPLPPDVPIDELLTFGTIDGPTTVVGLGGGISVENVVDVAAGDTYEVRATQTISELFGGEAGPTTARMVALPADLDDGAGHVVIGEVQAIPGAVPPAGWRLPCPASGRGILITDTTIHAAGGALPSRFGPGWETLGSGTDILVTEVDPFVCGGLPLTDGRDGVMADVVVSVGCVRARVNHSRHAARIRGQEVLFETTVDVEGNLFITNVLADVFDAGLADRLRLDVTIDGANRDRPIRTGLDLDDRTPTVRPADDYGAWARPHVGADQWISQTDEQEGRFEDLWNRAILPITRLTGDSPDPVAVVPFSFRAGVDGTGRKDIDRVVLRAGDRRADLTTQFTERLGTDRFRVRFPRENSWGECSIDPATGPGDEAPYLPTVLR